MPPNRTDYYRIPSYTSHAYLVPPLTHEQSCLVLPHKSYVATPRLAPPLAIRANRWIVIWDNVSRSKWDHVI
jgi:hypothetical protein